MGHALRKALGVLAAGQGLADGVADLAGQAGTPMLASSSLKAALDLDWDDPAARDGALVEVLAALDAVEAFVAAQPDPTGAVL
jgi:transposase